MKRFFYELYNNKEVAVKYSRDQQIQSWNEVLSNIAKYLGGKETKRESKIVEPKKKDEE